jgi:hypothetical protein
MTSDEKRVMQDPPGAETGVDLETFRAQLGTTFQVDLGAEHVPLRLVEAVEGRTGGGFRRFSVLFHGPAERALPQGLYSFRHDTLGVFALFIVPIIGSDTQRILYEACFSRPVAP